MKANSMQVKKTAIFLLKVSAGMLTVSLCARLVAGYIVRGWQRLRMRKDAQIDVIAPRFAPVLVVSTDDFDEDPLGKIMEDGYHTATFRRLAWLETLRKISIIVSVIGMAAAWLLWKYGKD